MLSVTNYTEPKNSTIYNMSQTATATVEMAPLRSEINTPQPTAPANQATTIPAPAVKSRAYLVIAQLTLVTFMTSMSSGLLTTSIPKMALDLAIPPQTYYWPLSVYGLTSGASLLVAGAVADVVGSKRVFLAGNLLLSAFVLGCGLAETAIELTMFRAMQGIAVALCLPTSVGILTKAVPPGRLRNVGFACTGLGQPLGFSVGLLFGGVFIDTVGWRVGWYVIAAAVFALLPVGAYVLPPDSVATEEPRILVALYTKVDWVGATIASASLSMLAYVLVQLSESASEILQPGVLAPLVLSLCLMPVFAWYMDFAGRRNWPVLIPNRLWKQLPFTTVCVMVLLSYAVMQTMELYCTLFFQNVQGLDALQSSLRLLPSMVIGAMLNLTTGLFIHRVSPMYLVLTSSLLCAVAPLLMALAKPEWPYWYAAFPAQVLQPVSLPRPVLAWISSGSNCISFSCLQIFSSVLGLSL
jgi:MFS family permease